MPKAKQGAGLSCELVVALRNSARTMASAARLGTQVFVLLANGTCFLIPRTIFCYNCVVLFSRHGFLMFTSEPVVASHDPLVKIWEGS